MTTLHYEHGNFAELIGYRLTAWSEGVAARRRAGHGDRRHLRLRRLLPAATQPGPPPGVDALAHQSYQGSLIMTHRDGFPRLTATATRSGGGRTIFFSSCEVRDAEGRLVATGSGTFKYRS